MQKNAFLGLRLISAAVFILLLFVGGWILRNHQRLFGVDPDIPRETSGAFCASIGRFLARLALGRGVAAEGELGRAVRRLRVSSGSGWGMLTCYTRAGMESNWVQQRAAHNTLPLWRKKIRTAQRVDVSALMDRVPPRPPVRLDGDSFAHRTGETC